MRVTKNDFSVLLNSLSNLMRRTVYLVTVNDTMYLSPYNDTIKCQDFYYFCMDDGFTNENLQKLIGFKCGFETAIAIVREG